MDIEKTIVGVGESSPAPDGSALTFSAHKEQTAKDCEAIADILTKLAAACREGDMAQFERLWIEGGTEEGDAKINALRELIVLRFAYRVERMKQSAAGDALGKGAIHGLENPPNKDICLKPDQKK